MLLRFEPCRLLHHGKSGRVNAFCLCFVGAILLGLLIGLLVSLLLRLLLLLLALILLCF